MSKDKNNSAWTPELLPAPQAETRTAAAAWIYALKFAGESWNPIQVVAQRNNLTINADSESAAEFKETLRKCFPKADLEMAEAIAKRRAPYQDVTDEVVAEVLSVTHTDGYELIPWREATLSVLAIEFLASLKASSAQLTEDAIVRVTSLLDDKLRGTTKNACQFISGQRTRLRKMVRMLTVAMLYLSQYRKDFSLESIQADVMQLVRSCPDPEFVIDEFPFDGFTLANGQINARGRFAFCEALKMMRGIIAKRDEIDEIIQASSKRWRISRMALIDLNILRLATYELCFEKLSSPRVLINEAVELAKMFGAEQSKNFVNGILQQLCNDNHIEVV